MPIVALGRFVHDLSASPSRRPKSVRFSRAARPSKAGFAPGDVILQIDGRTVHRFEDVQQAVRLNPNVPMTIVVRRDGQKQTLHVTPSRTELTDRFGNHYEIGLLGSRAAGWSMSSAIPATAIVQAGGETWNLTAGTLQAMWQIIKGTRATDELGGPLRIAQMSGEVAQGGVVAVLWFMAVSVGQSRADQFVSGPGP